MLRVGTLFFCSHRLVKGTMLCWGSRKMSEMGAPCLPPTLASIHSVVNSDVLMLCPWWG